METLTKDGNRVCPGCFSNMAQVSEQKTWACQRGCGFESSSPRPADWVTLHSVISMARQVRRFVRMYDETVPESQLVYDFRKFLEREDV